MGVLSRALLAGLAALAGCYSPSLRDCTVTCASPGDCAGDQVCGSDGLCAAPGRAGQCGSQPEVDAAVAVDATPRDAAIAVDAAVAVDAAPDASVAMVTLRIQIEGKGSVVVTGFGTCSSEMPQPGDCMYSVPAGVARNARAVDIKPDEMFDRWTSLVCAGSPAACTFTPFLTTTISAKFKKSGPGVR